MFRRAPSAQYFADEMLEGEGSAFLGIYPAATVCLTAINSKGLVERIRSYVKSAAMSTWKG